MYFLAYAFIILYYIIIYCIVLYYIILYWFLGYLKSLIQCLMILYYIILILRLFKIVNTVLNDTWGWLWIVYLGGWGTGTNKVLFSEYIQAGQYGSLLRKCFSLRNNKSPIVQNEARTVDIAVFVWSNIALQKMQCQKEHCHDAKCTSITQPPTWWVPGLKRQGREVDHSLPSNAEVKNAWRCTSTPPTRIDGVVIN